MFQKLVPSHEQMQDMSSDGMTEGNVLCVVQCEA